MQLITGATGNVGAKLVDDLLAHGESVRVFVRDPQKAERWRGKVDVARGDFTDPASFTRALDGVRGVFLMLGADVATAVRAASRPKLVFLSTIAAQDTPLQVGRVHREVEEAIEQSGLPHAFVRPGDFMSNAFLWVESIRAEATVYNPRGTGASAPIAPDDIAALASAALRNATDELILRATGGALLTAAEQVAILSRVLDRPLRCVDVPLDAAIDAMVQKGMPAHLAGAVGESLAMVRDGGGASRTDTVQRVLGRAPMTFEAWARANAAAFR